MVKIIADALIGRGLRLSL